MEQVNVIYCPNRPDKEFRAIQLRKIGHDVVKRFTGEGTKLVSFCGQTVFNSEQAETIRSMIETNDNFVGFDLIPHQ